MLKRRMTTHLRAAVKLAEGPEVDADDDGDEDPEQDQELALLQQVGLAGLPDELGDLPHRAVDRQIAQSEEDDETEDQAERADDESVGKQVAAGDAVELDRVQVGQDEAGLTPVCSRRPRPQAPGPEEKPRARRRRAAISSTGASGLRVVYIPSSIASFSSTGLLTGGARPRRRPQSPPSRARPNRSSYRSGRSVVKD